MKYALSHIIIMIILLGKVLYPIYTEKSELREVKSVVLISLGHTAVSSKN